MPISNTFKVSSLKATAKVQIYWISWGRRENESKRQNFQLYVLQNFVYLNIKVIFYLPIALFNEGELVSYEYNYHVIRVIVSTNLKSNAKKKGFWK